MTGPTTLAAVLRDLRAAGLLDRATMVVAPDGTRVRLAPAIAPVQTLPAADAERRAREEFEQTLFASSGAA